MIEVHRVCDPYTFAPRLDIWDDGEPFFSITGSLFEHVKDMARYEKSNPLDILKKEYMSDFPYKTEKVEEAFRIIIENEYLK